MKPKKDKVEALEKEYTEACNYLASLNREIDRLQRTLDGLNRKYETAMLRRQELQEETDIMMRRWVIVLVIMLWYCLQSAFTTTTTKAIHL